VEQVFIGPDGTQTVVHAVLETRAGDLWVAAGPSGLWRRHDGKWKRVNDETGLRDFTAAAILEGSNGDIWIGSLGQGLARYRDGRLAVWRQEDGLISATIVQILEDLTGNLWLGTDAGLQRIALAALTEERKPTPSGVVLGTRITREEGLPTPQFSGEHGNLAVRMPDGVLWFSLASGVVRIDPRDFVQPITQPVIRIQSASSPKGEMWNTEFFAANQAITLAPGTGSLQISFTSPRFGAPEKMRFRYRMVGLENAWQETPGLRTANYASLPPGSYRFEVESASLDGTWSPEPAVLDVVVQAFFWQTWQFRLALSLLTLGASALLIRKWSARRLQRRMAALMQERRVERERARIAQDLHDELGASLTEINFLGTMAADSVGDNPVRKKMEGIAERAQRMAKALDEIVWTVNPDNDTLSSTANYLTSRTQESLRTANIRCRLEIAEDLPQITLDSQVRHHLLMAVNEAVNNVMKHSGSHDCTLSLDVHDGNIIVGIRDTGCGFDPENIREGRNGIANLGRRLVAMGGSSYVESTLGEGSYVRLVVPLDGLSAREVDGADTADSAASL
jgi:signal transduction histidine kinase